eukprot:3259493-Rhodomonas_salina.1
MLDRPRPVRRTTDPGHAQASKTYVVSFSADQLDLTHTGRLFTDENVAVACFLRRIDLPSSMQTARGTATAAEAHVMRLRRQHTCVQSCSYAQHRAHSTPRQSAHHAECKKSTDNQELSKTKRTRQRGRGYKLKKQSSEYGKEADDDGERRMCGRTKCKATRQTSPAHHATLPPATLLLCPGNRARSVLKAVDRRRCWHRAAGTRRRAFQAHASSSRVRRCASEEQD